MASATVHTVWDCRWSRPGHHLTGVAEALQPEPTWVCVREGNRRAVCAEECAECSHWEPAAETATAIRMPNFGGAILTERMLEPTLALTGAELERAAMRVLLVVIALGFVAIGFTVLTAPLLVPVTVGLWLCGAAALGLAVFGRFPAD